MFSSQKPIFNRTLPSRKFDRLVGLWQQMREFFGDEAESIAEDSLFLRENRANKANYREHTFRLLISRQFSALLLGKPILDKYQNRADPQYQVTISFSPREIAEFLQNLPQQFLNYSHIQNYQRKLLPQINANVKNRERFMVELLEIIGPADDKNRSSLSGYAEASDPLQDILNRQVEQEKILDRLALQIDRNLDLLAIIRMTVEQVRSLLEIDRLIIYQLDVETKDNQTVDRVTYEALAHSGIASTLNLQADRCFRKDSPSRHKYLKGFTLVIDDIDRENNLAPCLLKLMRHLDVKSKLVVPIVVQKKLWGFTIAHQCSSPRQWKQRDVKFLQRVTEYLAIAIYQDQSYRQWQQQKDILERQVDRRAKDLQDALIAAQAAHNSKSAFLGNMSHELRTPLTCIIGLSSTLLHWSQDNSTLPIDKQRQYLQTIHDSGTKLLDLVNNILEFARVEAGNTLLNISEFSLQHLAKIILQSFQEKANNKQISLKLDLRVDKVRDIFHADRERVEQIIFNLLDNAIKFTPQSGEVTLRVWRDRKQAVFQVEDTGIGISKNQLPLLFETFQQLEEYRQRIYGGTGLGLALTKKLVELHGGTIEVDSSPGEGSVFTVWLEDRVTNLKSLESSQNISPVDGNKGTIVLLAEDETEATLICELLTAADYQIIWLIDGKSSIRQIELLQPNSILLDRQLPEFEKIVKTLKQLETTQNIKLILITRAEITAGDRDNLTKIGIDDYIFNPIRAVDLLKKVTTLRKDEEIAKLATSKNRKYL